MNKIIPKQIRQYIISHTVLTLATSSDKKLWAANLFYVSDDDLFLYFISSPSARHIQQALANPNVAVTITEDNQDWREIQGIQMEGRLVKVNSGNRAHVEKLYCAKYPFISDVLTSDLGREEEILRKHFSSSEFYVVIPDFIRFINNARGFGYKEEFKIIQSNSL